MHVHDCGYMLQVAEETAHRACTVVCTPTARESQSVNCVEWVRGMGCCVHCSAAHLQVAEPVVGKDKGVNVWDGLCERLEGCGAWHACWRCVRAQQETQAAQQAHSRATARTVACLVDACYPVIV